MAKYVLFYGLGGGFGGATNYHIENCKNDEDATDAAWQLACECYESYAGGNGLRDIKEIMDEDGVDEDEAEEIYNDERESWIDYYVEEYDEAKHSNLD